MRVKIKNSEICENCVNKSCSGIDVIERNTYTKFKSERYTCPLRLLQYGPTDEQMNTGFIDGVKDKKKTDCIYCCLCAVHCSKDNIELQEYTFPDKEFKDTISNIDRYAAGCSNILAMTYLHSIFDFAANTSVNKSMPFDGFLCDSDNNWYFVEVDSNDDSLECCRRLLGDILVQNHCNNQKVSNGIMILNNLPKEGSHEIYTLVEKVTKFPNIKHIKIYAITFSLLRHFAINFNKNEKSVDELLFDMTSETLSDYLERLEKLGIISENMRDIR